MNELGFIIFMKEALLRKYEYLFQIENMKIIPNALSYYQSTAIIHVATLKIQKSVLIFQ